MELRLVGVTETDSVTTVFLDKLGNGLLTMAAVSELKHVLHYLADESQCRFVVFRGGAAWFCRGLDVDNFSPKQIDYDGFRKWEEALKAIDDLNKVTLAVIEGECFGAGVDLALTCDMRIAGDGATFCHNELNKGILPGQTMFQLGKYCGLGRMLELIQTGRSYSAREAFEMGIVNRCLDPTKLEEGLQEALGAYAAVNIDMLMLTRRLSKESYSIVYDNFIGSYLAAQHRVISKPAISGRVDRGETTSI